MTETLRQPYVIGVLGSPHRNGNTETLLKEFLSGAEKAGAQTEIIYISKLKYSNCRGCNACHKEGNCILNDDANRALEHLMEADCIAISSPVYSMGITADLKGLIDRMHYLWVRQFKVKNLVLPPDRKTNHFAYYLSTAGMNREDVFNSAFATMQALFNILGFAYCKNILCPDLDRIGGIKNDTEKLKLAYDCGFSAVTDLKADIPFKNPFHLKG